MIGDNVQCLSDPRDRVLIGATPVLPMPRFGTLTSARPTMPLTWRGGIFVAAVIGRCRSARPEWKTRLVVNGHFFPMEWAPDPSQTQSVVAAYRDVGADWRG